MAVEVERLLAATMSGDATAVAQYIMVHSVPPDATNAAGFTPLIVAAQAGHASIVRQLLQCHRALPDLALPTGMTALMMASHKGHARVVQMICEHRANVSAVMSDGKTAMVIAIESGHADVVDVLINCGSHFQNNAGSMLAPQPPLHIAACRGQEEIVRRMLSRGRGMAVTTAASGATALHAAMYCQGVVANDVPKMRAVVELLIADGGVPIEAEAEGKTALLVAVAVGGDGGIVRALLGATVAACSARGSSCRTSHARNAYVHAAATFEPSGLLSDLFDAARKERLGGSEGLLPDSDGDEVVARESLARAVLQSDWRALGQLTEPVSPQQQEESCKASACDTRGGLITSAPTMASVATSATALQLAALRGDARAVRALLLSRRVRWSADELWAAFSVAKDRTVSEHLRGALPPGSGPGVSAPNHPLFERLAWEPTAGNFRYNASDGEAMADALAEASAFYGIACETRLATFRHASAREPLRGNRITRRLDPRAPFCSVPMRTALSLATARAVGFDGLHELCLANVPQAASWSCELVSLSLFAMHQRESTAAYLLPLARMILPFDKGEDALLPLTWPPDSPALARLTPLQREAIRRRRETITKTITTLWPLAFRRFGSLLRAACPSVGRYHQGPRPRCSLHAIFSADRLLRMCAAVHARAAGRDGVFHPIATMNHPAQASERRQIAVLSTDLVAQRHLLYTWRTLEPGDEVLYQYATPGGQHACREEFFATYGFAVEGMRSCLADELLT